ncbi:MAG: Uma2 family endonuclease [Hyphomicrobiaceae bacterium]
MNQSTFVKVDRETFFRFVTNAPEDERYEWVGGRIVQQQAGGTKRHARIGARFLEAAHRQLDRDLWDAFAERGVETHNTVRYADVVVEPVGGDSDSLAATAPSLIVEVLSRTSSDRDLNEKPDEYLQLATLQAYIVASQDEPACLVWVRQPDGTFPAEPTEITGTTSTILVPDLKLAFSLADIYRGSN